MEFSDIASSTVSVTRPVSFSCAADPPYLCRGQWWVRTMAMIMMSMMMLMTMNGCASAVREVTTNQSTSQPACHIAATTTVAHSSRHVLDGDAISHCIVQFVKNLHARSIGVVRLIASACPTIAAPGRLAHDVAHQRKLFSDVDGQLTGLSEIPVV